MGRKKRRSENDIIFCFYCDREFSTEHELVHHQKEKHLRCPTCFKRMVAMSGLVLHASQVHKRVVSTVPNAIEGRENPRVDVFGMHGIPPEVLAARNATKRRKPADGSGAGGYTALQNATQDASVTGAVQPTEHTPATAEPVVPIADVPPPVAPAAAYPAAAATGLSSSVAGGSSFGPGGVQDDPRMQYPRYPTANGHPHALSDSRLYGPGEVLDSNAYPMQCTGVSFTGNIPVHPYSHDYLGQQVPGVRARQASTYGTQQCPYPRSQYGPPQHHASSTNGESSAPTWRDGARQRHRWGSHGTGPGWGPRQFPWRPHGAVHGRPVIHPQQPSPVSAMSSPAPVGATLGGKTGAGLNSNAHSIAGKPGSSKPVQKEVEVVFARDDGVCMEELRAMLPRYRLKAETTSTSAVPDSLV